VTVKKNRRDAKTGEKEEGHFSVGEKTRGQENKTTEPLAASGLTRGFQNVENEKCNEGYAGGSDIVGARRSPNSSIGIGGGRPGLLRGKGQGGFRLPGG